MIKKLYVSIITFIIFIFAATTMTYAWLSMATSNSVEELMLNTYSDDLLEVSLDGTNYYNKLPSNLLTNLVKNVIFKDITSTDGINFNYGIRGGSYKAYKNRDYVGIDLYFRTKSRYAHHVYLSNNVSDEVTYDELKPGTFIVSEGRTWKSDITFLYGPDHIMNEGDIHTYYVSEAIRVSTVEKPLNDLDDRTNLKTKIFDLSGNEERGFGKPYGSYDYYSKKEEPINLPNVFPETIYQLSEFIEDEPYAKDDNSYILTLIDNGNTYGEYNLPYYEGKLTINIWAEGWDADLFDSVFSDHVKIQFEFKAVFGKKEE